jgi:hypothetical protein
MGERAFVHWSTLSRGRVPHLPVELRQIVYAHTFPHSVVRCRACNADVLLATADGELVQARPYTILGGDQCTCMRCVRIFRARKAAPG